MPQFKNARLLGTHDAGIAAVRFSRDARHLLTASSDQTVRLWPISAGPSSSRQIVRFEERMDPEYKRPLALFPLAMDVHDDRIALGLKHGFVQVFSEKTGERLAALDNPQEQSSHPRDFYTVAFHPADANVLAGSNGAYLNIWDVAAGSISWRKTKFRGINSICFLRGGQFLLAMEWDPWLHLFEYPTGKQIDFENEIADGSLNLVTCKAAPPGASADVAISATDGEGGNLLVLSLDQPQALWKMETTSRAHGLVFTPDARHLLTANEDGTIEIWDLNSTENSIALHVNELPDVAPMLEAGSKKKRNLIYMRPDLGDDDLSLSAVHAIDISPDGKTIAAGLAGGAVILADLAM